MAQSYVPLHKAFEHDSSDLTAEFPLYLTALFDGHLSQGLLPIRQSWPDSLKRRLASAIISNNFGIGMDYALKRYVAGAEYHSSDGSRLDERAEYLVTKTTEAIEDCYEFEKDDAPHQDFFGYFALRRALGSLGAAHMLGQQGYLAEAAVVARQSLETLAWADSASAAAPEVEPLSISTNRAISLSRRAHPAIGKLYGTLSKFAHWHPDVHLAFLTDVEGRTAVLERSVGHKICALAIVLGLCQVALEIFEAHMNRHYPLLKLDVLAPIRREIQTAGAATFLAARGRIRAERLLVEILTAWADLPADA